MRQKKKIIAFTLAETLISLVIIGVVASLTIPSIIVNYQKHQTEVKLKKIYSALSEAINMAKIKNGDPKTWDWSENYSNCVWGGFIPTKIFSLIKPHLNIAKDYMGSSLCAGRGVLVAKTISGSEVNIEHQYLLQDGTAISINRGGYSWSQDPWTWIRIDINGKNGPNVFGKDIFNLFFYANKGFHSAHGVSWHSPYNIKNNRQEAIDSCKSSSLSTACLDLIIHNNWKIPDDYPW